MMCQSQEQTFFFSKTKITEWPETGPKDVFLSQSLRYAGQLPQLAGFQSSVASHSLISSLTPGAADAVFPI